MMQANTKPSVPAFLNATVKSETEGTHPGDSAAPARLLVADDEEEVTRALVRGLARVGYAVTGVLCGEDALRKLEEQPFDLLLTDMHMPGMRGDELQRRARERDPELAVILITAAHDTAVAVNCLKEGAYDFILKPAPLADITVRVQRALERRRLLRESRDHQADLERKLAAQAKRIRSMFQNSLQALNQALEAKDEATQYHSARVADLTGGLAARLLPGDAEFSSLLRVAALFHDIGKIGVSEAILSKAGPLTPEEEAIVQRHPVIGEAILRPIFHEAKVLAMVRHQNERVDGAGSPDGLAIEAIPLGARIIAVADAFDAMTSGRASRAGQSMEKALETLCHGAGSHWDVKVVEALVAMDADGELEALHYGEAFDVEPVAAAVEPEASASEPETAAVESEAAVEPEGGASELDAIAEAEAAAEAEENAAQSEASAGPPAKTAAKATVRSTPLPFLRGRRPIVYTAGDLDDNGIDRLRSKVGGLIGQGENDFIVDMRQVGCLTVEAVQFLYLLHMRTKESNGTMALRDVPEHAMNAFRDARLESILTFETAPLQRPRRISPYDRKKRLDAILQDRAQDTTL